MFVSARPGRGTGTGMGGAPGVLAGISIAAAWKLKGLGSPRQEFREGLLWLDELKWFSSSFLRGF